MGVFEAILAQVAVLKPAIENAMSRKPLQRALCQPSA